MLTSALTGKGSFFKSHKDTPRGDHMFGSLVFILPSPHAGGELVLKHGEDEYTFNAASTLKDLTNSIAYVAFYSDVDHEVREVTDGHRITVTYNLSWAKSGGNTPPASGGEPVLRPIADIQLDRSSFQSTLVFLLAILNSFLTAVCSVLLFSTCTLSQQKSDSISKSHLSSKGSTPFLLAHAAPSVYPMS